MLSDPKYQPGDPPRPETCGAGIVISPDTRRADRIPPGQVRTRKWPVLHAADVPEVDLSAWRLEIRGLVQTPLGFTWEEFRALPRIQVFADFHCVTTWSRLGNLWEGVSVRAVLDRAGIDPRARFAIARGLDLGGTWTTNMPLSDCLTPDALFADTHDGQPLDPDHGAPVRLIVPQLYAWKSAKWVCGLELTEHDRPGYWERGGYHDRGDPWTESRFRDGP